MNSIFFIKDLKLQIAEAKIEKLEIVKEKLSA